MPDPVVNPVVETPVAPAEGVTPASPSPISIADDALVSVRVDGKDVNLPWKEARQGVMFHSAFTQKTQGIAEERRQFEAERAAFAAKQPEYDKQLGELRSVLADPQALMALYMRQQGQRQPQEPQPLTTASIPQLQTSLQQYVAEQVKAAQAELQQQQQQTIWQQDLDRHTSGLTAKYPRLGAIDGLQLLLENKARVMGARTLDEGKQFMSVAAEALNSALLKAHQEEAKAAEVARQQASHGIEPRGGIGVIPKVKDVKKLEELDADFAAFLTGMEAGG